MKSFIAGILTAGVLLGSACNRGSEEPIRLADSAVVAKVNGVPILKKRVDGEFYQEKRKYRQRKNHPLNDNQLLWLRSQALNQVIQEVLLRQEASKLGVKVTPDELEAFRAQIRQGYQPEAFQRSLEVVEISQKDWEEKLRTRLLIKKLIDKAVNSKVTVGERDLKKYFKEHREEFQKREQVRALHVLVETEEEARRILKWIEKGRDFADLAREHSVSPEGAAGGDLGYFEAGHLPEEFDPVFRLKAGEISDIIRTPYGFHVFKVVDKKPARNRSLEESRKEIHSRLLEKAREQAFRQWLAGIKTKAKIKISYDVLEKIH